MSKKKKEKSKKSNKTSDKKSLKKALKAPSSKNAAKNISKPAQTKKAKPVVKKTSVKAAKPNKTKSPVKASHPNTKVPENQKAKKAVVKKPAPKKAEVKKVASTKKGTKPVVKDLRSGNKQSKPLPKAVKKEQKPVKKVDTKPVKAIETKKVIDKKPSIPVAAPVKKETAPAAKKAEETASKKSAPDANKSTNVLAITNTIPVTQKTELPLSKIASISHSITNPIKKTDSYSVKAEKEPNGKFELEFVVHSSAEMLYEFLSTPSGLSEWFCDDLNIRNGIYTFIWDDQLQQARLLKTIEFQLVRFQWVDKTDGSYFEFRIQRDDLTNDISLIITDFADSVSERESSKLLWHSQVEKLMHVIGSIF